MAAQNPDHAPVTEAINGPNMAAMSARYTLTAVTITVHAAVTTAEISDQWAVHHAVNEAMIGRS